MSRKVTLYIAIGVIAYFFIQSCAEPSKSESKQQKLTITGASTIAPLVSELGKRFEQKHPGTRIDVHTGGSARGLADARQKLSDIGMVSKALSQEEQKGMRVFPIGRDGISVIVHADNPLDKIVKNQVVAVYTGRIKNWKQLGGKDAPITTVHKAEGRSTLKLFLDYFGVDNNAVKADVVIGDNQQGIKTVAGNPNSIGYVSIGSAQQEINQNVKVKLLSLDGVEATNTTVEQGSFPLLRQLNLVTKGEPTALTKEFIDFARAKENHDILRKENFVPAKN
ncbi:MAG: phosphate ABC transporter substrate-binding protein [Cyanobacteria bacterium P01_D01_bin.50]